MDLLPVPQQRVYINHLPMYGAQERMRGQVRFQREPVLDDNLYLAFSWTFYTFGSKYSVTVSSQIRDSVTVS